MKVLLAITVALAVMAPAAQAQSVDAGAKVFRKCAGCHAIGPGARNKTGPVLTGVVGRPAASYEGYRYGASLTAAAAAGLVWDSDQIFAWLANPTAFLRDRLGDNSARAKMSFRLTDEQDRRDVIAFLGTFSTAATDTDGNRICVGNSSDQSFLFAVETREGAREVARLEPQAEICSDVTNAADGIVSVYLSADALEGCSRIVAAGAREELRDYAEFDRCLWGSHG